MGSSEVFHDYLDLQCDFQYKAKPVYPKQKGERRSTTALLKTKLPFQEERGVTFKRQEISQEENAGDSWQSVDQFGCGFWWRT